MEMAFKIKIVFLEPFKLIVAFTDFCNSFLNEMSLRNLVFIR